MYVSVARRFEFTSNNNKHVVVVPGRPVLKPRKPSPHDQLLSHDQQADRQYFVIYNFVCMQFSTQ